MIFVSLLKFTLYQSLRRIVRSSFAGRRETFAQFSNSRQTILTLLISDNLRAFDQISLLAAVPARFARLCQPLRAASSVSKISNALSRFVIFIRPRIGCGTFVSRMVASCL